VLNFLACDAQFQTPTNVGLQRGFATCTHAYAELNQGTRLFIQRAGIGEDFAKLLVRILKFWKSIAESNKGFGEFSLFSTHQIILDIGFNLGA
jgi:hypothetical protein